MSEKQQRVERKSDGGAVRVVREDGPRCPFCDAAMDDTRCTANCHASRAARVTRED